MERAKVAIKNGEYDVIILDEINVSVYFELVKEEMVLELIENKHPKVELVLTGRNASEKIMEKADLVTEMKEIKHYYTKGVEARIGIEN